jgi:hypothetical protein
MESFWNNLANILKSVPENPTAVTLIGFAIVAVVAFLLFSRGASNHKLAVFFSIFFAFMCLMFILMVYNKSLITKETVNIPKNIKYSYYHVFTNIDSLGDCNSFVRASLSEIGYGEVRPGGNSSIGLGYFDDPVGLGSTANCSEVAGKYLIYGNTFGTNGDVVASKNNEFFQLLNMRTDKDFNFKVKSIDNISFYSRSYTMNSTDIESCLGTLGEGFKKAGESDFGRNGELIWIKLKYGYLIGSCPSFETYDEGGVAREIYAVSFQAFGFESTSLLNTITLVEKYILNDRKF